VKANIVTVLDVNGQGRVAMLAGPDGSVVLQLIDAEGNMRAGLGVGPNGEPSMILVDGSGRPRLSAQLNSNGNPEIVYAGERGERRIDLSLDEEDSPSLAMFGPDGKPRLLAMVPGQGEGRVMTKQVAHSLSPPAAAAEFRAPPHFAGPSKTSCITVTRLLYRMRHSDRARAAARRPLPTPARCRLGGNAARWRVGRLPTLSPIALHLG
jgi:hypothetical protein